MRLLLLVACLAALLAGAAVLSRPGPEAFDVMLAQAVRHRVSRTEGAAVTGSLDTASLSTCRDSPETCASAIRDQFTLRFEPHLFHSRVEIRGFGRQASCLGLFGRFYCSQLER